MERMTRALMLVALLAAMAAGVQKAAAAQDQFLRRRRYQVNYLRPLYSVS